MDKETCRIVSERLCSKIYARGEENESLGFTRTEFEDWCKMDQGIVSNFEVIVSLLPVKKVKGIELKYCFIKKEIVEFFQNELLVSIACDRPFIGSDSDFELELRSDLAVVQKP